MYQQHFGMHTDPFPLSPKLAFVYPSRAFGETMAHLVYGIEQAEDIILITGGIGTGKTLAVHSLLVQIQRVLEPVLINVARLNFQELLKYILLELGESVPPQADTPDLLQQLKRVLNERRKAGRKVLLIIDEAQHLDVNTLESLRLLTNLSTPEAQCLQLVLVGQHGLEESIGRRELAQLNQRIRVRYRIEPLSRQEVEAYLDHRVRVAGCTRHLFRPGAIDRIYALSHGIPRVVNILASRALLAAFVAGKAMVEPSHVRVEDLPPVTDAAEPPPLSPQPRAAARPESAAAESPVPMASVPPPPIPIRPLEPAPATPPPSDPEGESGPYLIWPAGSSEPKKSRHWGLVAGLATVVAVAALLIWQWPNLASPRQTLASSSSARVAQRPAEPELQRTTPEEPARADTAVQDTLAVASPEPTTAEPKTVTPVEKPAPQKPVPAVPSPEKKVAARVPGSEVRQPAFPRREPPAPALDRTHPGGPGGSVEPAKPPTAPAGELAVHVGSFQDPTRAEQLRQRLADAGLAVYEIRETVDGNPWVRVYAGPFETRAAAEQARDRLKGDGISAYARVITVGQ